MILSTKKSLLLTLLVTFALSSIAWAQNNDSESPAPLVLTDGQDEYPLGLHLELLEDPSGELTIEEVSSPAFEARFKPSQEAVPNFGFTDSVYWARLRLDNESPRRDEWLLEVNFANMHYVDLYTPLPGGEGFTDKQSGALRPASTRDVLFPNIVLELDIPGQSQQTYFLRFQNGASMTLALTLWNKDAFFRESQWVLMLHWLFIGSILALLVYHLFLLFSLREASYLYFVILLTSLILEELSYSGYLEVYFLPSMYFLKPIYYPLSFSVLIISMILFAGVFLELATRQPKLHRMLFVLVAGWGVLTLLTPFTEYHLLANLMIPWAFLSLIAVVAAGGISWWLGYRPAWFFLTAWIGMVIGFLVVFLVRWGIVPSTVFTENLYLFGFIWMAVCWSLALADRINLYRITAENASRNLRQSENRLSQILDSLPLGVILYGKDEKPKYINQRTAEILSDPAKGIQPDISIGRNIAQAIQYFSLRVAGDSQVYPLENFPIFKALQGEPSTADDIEMDRGDERVSLEFWARPIEDEAGNVESAVVAFQDITGRKRSETELVEYRRHLESMVGKRTEELNAANKELRLRVEWLSAIVLINEIMAGSYEFTQIYEKIIEIINRLFSFQDSFIAELDASGKQLKILSHSCHAEHHPDLKDSFTSLPENVQFDPNPEQAKLIFFSKEQVRTMSGPIGDHLQLSNLQALMLLPLIMREQVFGFLGMELSEEGRNITSEEANLLGVFSIDIAQLIEISRLYEHTRMLITAEERNRLARELHDSVTQTLFTASVLAEATPRLWDKDQAIARQNMDKLSLLIRGALAEMRTMLIELRSEDLITQTLDQLLITLVEAARARSNAVINVSIMDIPELPKELTISLYRIAREALNNALVHAAAARINISLHMEMGQVELRIQDDGCGFDPQGVGAGHLGIRIMTERAAEIGGEVRIQSEPGRGTDMLITCPIKPGAMAEYE